MQYIAYLVFKIFAPNQNAENGRKIDVKFDMLKFEKQMSNLIDYSVGFLDGAQESKHFLLDRLGKGTIKALYKYIDTNAKLNPKSLQHVYEWYQVGSPNSRLFDLDYTVSNVGLSINSTFKQSRTLSEDATTPFYNKANIMENGIAVTVTPRGNNPLVFHDGGELVFVKAPITIENPGGIAVEGSYRNIFDLFFAKYFSQSFLNVGIGFGSKPHKNVVTINGHMYVLNPAIFSVLQDKALISNEQYNDANHEVFSRRGCTIFSYRKNT